MYFIYDAMGRLFGNPKGYKTLSSAQSVATRKRSELWSIYDGMRVKIPFSTLVYKIKLLED